MIECIAADDPNLACGGEVQEYWSRSGYTKAARCEVHWIRHNEILDGVARRYPDSDVPPSWFDPTYAGEHWNDDY